MSTPNKPKTLVPVVPKEFNIFSDLFSERKNKPQPKQIYPHCDSMFGMAFIASRFDENFGVYD